MYIQCVGMGGGGSYPRSMEGRARPAAGSARAPPAPANTNGGNAQKWGGERRGGRGGERGGAGGRGWRAGGRRQGEGTEGRMKGARGNRGATEKTGCARQAWQTSLAEATDRHPPARNAQPPPPSADGWTFSSVESVADEKRKRLPMDSIPVHTGTLNPYVPRCVAVVGAPRAAPHACRAVAPGPHSAPPQRALRERRRVFPAH